MSADIAPMAVDLAHEASFQLGGVEVRPSTREIVAGDRREVVEPRIMQVLVALARRCGEVVSRDDLIAACWGGRAVGEDAINRCIAGVRRLAETYGGFSIETVARVGYRLGEAKPARPGPWRKPRAGTWAWALAVVIVLAAAGSGAWLIRDRLGGGPAAPARVAVLPFDTIGASQEARALADGLLDELVGALSGDQVDAVSRSASVGLRGPEAHERLARLGAAYVLDGSVASDGRTLTVRVHLDDVRARLTLWSKAFSAPAGEADALRAEVAGRAIDVTQWLMLPGIRRGGADAPTLAAYIDASDSLQNGGVYPAVAIAKYRQVVARAPRFSFGHSGLGFALNASEPSLPPQARARAAAESLAEGDAALSLDPRNGEGYQIRELHLPAAAWRAREDLMLKGLAVDPGPPVLPYNDGLFLAQVGRTGEAAAMMGRAVASEPYWGDARAQLAYLLALFGRTDEAKAVQARPTRLGVQAAKLAEFAVAEQTAPGTRAIAMLDDPVIQAWLGAPAAAQVERTVLRARASGAAPDRRAAALAVRTAVEAGAFPALVGLSDLAALGDVDGAFAASDRAFSPDVIARAELTPASLDTIPLFSVFTRAMRQDRRFMGLAMRLGLVDYWRTSGHWPDFCAEPGLPYDCKAEAARLGSR